MPGILVRVLVAVIACILAYGLIPPVARVIGFDVGGDIMTIIKYIIAGIAVFYIIFGGTPTWPWRKTP